MTAILNKKSPLADCVTISLAGGKVDSINYGDVISVDTGKEPDWFKDNWYKILTAVGVVVGISNIVK